MGHISLAAHRSISFSIQTKTLKTVSVRMFMLMGVLKIDNLFYELMLRDERNKIYLQLPPNFTQGAT